MAGARGLGVETGRTSLRAGLIDRGMKTLVARTDFEVGNPGENRVAYRLHRYGWSSRDVTQQYRVGRYRIDFAWVVQKIALEADGWVHQSAVVALRDRQRDDRLRLEGWLVFRVNVDADNLEEQLARVSAVVRAIR